VSTLTAWNLSYDQNGFTIDASDSSVNELPYYIKQKTTYNGAYVDEFSFPVVFTDPCSTTAFVAQTIPDVVNFITVESANVVPGVKTMLPKLTDSTNLQYGTDPLISICQTQIVKATDAGTVAHYISVNDASTEFLVESATAENKGEH
jgi:hypothetical protein